MTRRTPAEIAAALDARSAKLKEESERRRSVAADPVCNHLWDAECSLHRARLITTDEMLRGDVAAWAADIKALREARWEKIREELKA